MSWNEALTYSRPWRTRPSHPRIAEVDGDKTIIITETESVGCTIYDSSGKTDQLMEEVTGPMVGRVRSVLGSVRRLAFGPQRSSPSQERGLNGRRDHVHLCIAGRTRARRWLARSTNPNLVRFLIGLVLPAFSCLGITVTDHMVTKAVNTSGGCIVPTSAATFLTTDQAVWLWFNVSDAKNGDVASATWYSPSGAAYSSASWDPLASGGGRCFWWSMNIAGYPPASSPGNWSIRVSWNGSSLFSTGFVIAVPGPSINAGGILNAASFAAGTPVAPGSMVAVFGNFGLNSSFVAPVFPLSTSLGGLSMQFSGGIKAPLYYVSGAQVSLQVPWELATQSQPSIAGSLNGQSGSAQAVNIATYSPGIFSVNAQGTGQGVIVDSSQRLVDSSNPAIAGSTEVRIFCNGLGPVTNQPASGSVSPASPPATTTAPAAVTIGGAPAQVSFSGLAPGFVGGYQVDALVPLNSAGGDSVPVVISIGGKTSNTVTMAVKAAPVNPNATLASVNPASGNTGQI